MKSTMFCSTVPAEAQEHKVVLLLCLLAAIHVFIFSASFPFFNNVDEGYHFDLVIKYSQGHAPRGLEPLSVESLPYLALYNSLQYLGTPALLPNGQFPPPAWTLPPDQFKDFLVEKGKMMLGWINVEEGQPPLYYTIAGAWWQVGKGFGINNGSLLYWLRFLNIFFVVLLVCLSYIIACLIFPDRKFVRLGTPAILAFMPQTAFYSISNDVLSPLCFGVLFLSLLFLLRSDIPDFRSGILVGLALAATFLTKSSNLPLFTVATGMVTWKIWSLSKDKKLFLAWPFLILLVSCAGFPIAIWVGWIKYHFGDFSASAAKIAFLGWTLKPFDDWWHHPVFQPHGFWVFISGLISTFWQGEFLWHRQPMPSPAAGITYVILSIFLIGVAVGSLSPYNAAINPLQRRMLWLSFGCFVASVAFLAWLSIIFDFGLCFYPSKQHPYFTSGRLILGALIPFILLFVFGLDCLMNRLKNHLVRQFALVGLIILMLADEITTDWPIFSNSYNWFHL
jgi:hypothetical protein